MALGEELAVSPYMIEYLTASGQETVGQVDEGTQISPSDGYVVGGCASIAFDSSGQWKPDHKALLFRLKKAGTVDYMEYPAMKAAAVFTGSTHGPTFGSGNGVELQFLINKAYSKQVNVGAGGAFDKKNHSAADTAGSQQFTEVEVYRVTESLLVESDEPWRKMAVGWQMSFNPAVPISPGSPGYKADPKLKDKIHVVAFVVDGTSVNLLSRVLLDKLKAMRVLVNQRSIPMMILMTKIDKIDELVSKDLKSVYHSVQVRDTMEELSDKTGVPMSYIMPVKSYDRETELEPTVDILTLTALRQMLRLADDFFEEQMDLLNIHTESESDEDGEAGVAQNLNVRQEKGVDKKGISANKNIL